MSCPFISKEVLSRLPPEQKQELEKYYHDFIQKKANAEGPKCPVMDLDEEKINTE